jgi:hypothetical protein
VRSVCDRARRRPHPARTRRIRGHGRHAEARTRGESALTGAIWNEAAARAAMGALGTDYAPLGDMRASADYRRQAAQNLLYRFSSRRGRTIRCRQAMSASSRRPESSMRRLREAS